MSKTLATRMAFGDELLKIAETNPDFVVCNADTKGPCGLEKFGKRFPEREFSFGIAEQDLVGGRGRSGRVRKQGVPCDVCDLCLHARLRAGADLCLLPQAERQHHRHAHRPAGRRRRRDACGDRGCGHSARIPQYDDRAAGGCRGGAALAHAAVEFTGPLYIRLHRNPVADVYDPESYRFELGKAHTVLDYGTDLTMIVSGILLKKAIDAAAICAKRESAPAFSIWRPSSRSTVRPF